MDMMDADVCSSFLFRASVVAFASFSKLLPFQTDFSAVRVSHVSVANVFLAFWLNSLWSNFEAKCLNEKINQNKNFHTESHLCLMHFLVCVMNVVQKWVWNVSQKDESAPKCQIFPGWIPPKLSPMHKIWNWSLFYGFQKWDKEWLFGSFSCHCKEVSHLKEWKIRISDWDIWHQKLAEFGHLTEFSQPVKCPVVQNSQWSATWWHLTWTHHVPKNDCMNSCGIQCPAGFWAWCCPNRQCDFWKSQKC